ncbi:hypothetical protein [Shewanella xiamenensis]|uniref:hypothetical protein n=1 Tax=Shewanella xiamenensis TaxID=332186 RepID=UPI0024A6E18D|nr:hypothetical protein [Shewanella xiamenensis]
MGEVQATEPQPYHPWSFLASFLLFSLTTAVVFDLFTAALPDDCAAGGRGPPIFSKELDAFENIDKRYELVTKSFETNFWNEMYSFKSRKTSD